MTPVTKILDEIEAGDSAACERLLLLVYEQLRVLAAARLSKEKPGQTLQATALVHDAFLALVDSKQPCSWESRAHFFGAAAEAMQRILINNAIRKRRPKHGGHLQRVEFDEATIVAETGSHDVEALAQALKRLSEVDRQAADVVKLRYFAGLSVPQIAEVLQLSARTVDRRWAYARAWLHHELTSR